MSIKWDPDLFMIGIEDIDKQHALFFEKIDVLKDAYESNTENEAIAQILKFIGEYSQYHFKYEEELMEKYSFPELEHQRQEHKRFYEGYVKLLERFDNEGPSRKLMLSIYNYISNWLVEHISGADKAFGVYVNKEKE